MFAYLQTEQVSICIVSKCGMKYSKWHNITQTLLYSVLGNMNTLVKQITIKHRFRVKFYPVYDGAENQTLITYDAHL